MLRLNASVPRAVCAADCRSMVWCRAEPQGDDSAGPPLRRSVSEQRAVTTAPATTGSAGSAPERNRLRPEDRAVHDWYRFVLSFPPHLVRDYLEVFGVDSTQTVLDPFCGTGTTLVATCVQRG